MLEKEKLSHIVAVGFLLIAVQFIAVAQFYGISAKKRAPSPYPQACTQEAKQCPDGSYVSRTGPNCEFEECAKPSIAQNDMNDWQTYRNEEYGFEVRYPEGWTMQEYEGYVGFKPSKFKIAGHSIAVRVLRDISREEAIHEAGFQTREEAIRNDDLPLDGMDGLGDANYLSTGSGAGAAVPAAETTISGMPALLAEIPIRLYDDERYIGAGSGISILIFGEREYALFYIQDVAAVERETVDQILSTFRFVDQKTTTIPEEIPTNETSCMEKMGDWRQVGASRAYSCIFTYADGGKECKNSDECEGSCVVYDYNQAERGKGICEQDTDFFGCYATIENFKAGYGILCID